VTRGDDSFAAASTGTKRDEAGLPRRVTPDEGPGTRVRTYMHTLLEATRHTKQTVCDAACKE